MTPLTEKVIQSLYGGDVKIAFSPKTHRYQKVGEKNFLTSVTAVTGLVGFPKEVAMKWVCDVAREHWDAYIAEREGVAEIDKAEACKMFVEALQRHKQMKDEAATNGSLVHAWAEAYALAKISGKPMPAIEPTMPDQVVAGINGFLDWVNSHKVEFLDAERIVFSKSHNFVGIMDALCKIDGKKYVVDYKTSKGVYDDMYLQVSAYHGAYVEESKEEVETLIVHFDKETGAFNVVEIPPKDLQRDYQAFLGLLDVKERLKERARV